MNTHRHEWNFEKLVAVIQQAHDELAAKAGRAVNFSLTMRNWLIGFYILEYEQRGTDRAQYGEALMDRLAKELGRIGVPRADARELRRYRLFYSVYPQIREALTPEFRTRLFLPKNLGVGDSQISSATQISGQMLISKLSFTHLAELITIDEETEGGSE